MNYWLVKSEPTTFAWEQLEKDKKACWDGVRNFAARNHLKGMQKGDHVLFYHSNEGKEIVGIAKVLKPFYQDPTTDDTNWVAVDLGPHKRLQRPVTLDEIKKEKRLKDIALVRIGRLSVMPLAPAEYDVIIALSEQKAKG